MLKTLVVLPNGTELFSGVGTTNAIKGATITECVNGAQELTLGSTCANMVELDVITPNGGLNIFAGAEIAVYKVDDNGRRYIVGRFTTEKPTRPSPNSMRITAYDRVTWLDKDLTIWLRDLKGWPYSLYTFASMVCKECGLVLINTEIPNGSYEVSAFTGDGITGRQLMQWVGQIAGQFCRATPHGQIEFAWYTDSNVRITGTNNTEGIPHYINGLTYEDYNIASIDKVQLRQNEADIGTIYPASEEGANTYVITGNPLLTSSAAGSLVSVAQTLYEQLQFVSYTPCKVSIPANVNIHAGQIVRVTDRNGTTFTVYVMTKKQRGQRDTLECTGSPNRNTTTVVNNQTYAALSGKVLNLRADVDGVKVENKDLSGKVADLSLSVDGVSLSVKEQQESIGSIDEDIAASNQRAAQLELNIDGIASTVQAQQKTVEGIQKDVSKIEQSATEISLRVQSIQDDGVKKLSTDFGLTVNDSAVIIHRSGSEMTNQLNERGMYVVRSADTPSETIMLKADASGVLATDVSVRNYLIIGDHARFENYSDGSDSERTACFWI